MTTVETYFKPKSPAPGGIACNFTKPALLFGRKWDAMQHAMESEKTPIVIKQDKTLIAVIKTLQRLNPLNQEHNTIRTHFKTPGVIPVALVMEQEEHGEGDFLRTLMEADGSSGWRILDV